MFNNYTCLTTKLQRYKMNLFCFGRVWFEFTLKSLSWQILNVEEITSESLKKKLQITHSSQEIPLVVFLSYGFGQFCHFSGTEY